MNTLETVGKVSKPFGREGELIINLYDTFPEEFDKREPLFASIDALAVPLFFEKFERRGRSSALVTFADFDTQERAAELVGLELSLRTDDEEADDDIIYLEDLVGFRATFDGHPLRGEITDYIDSEQNPLFAITAEGREILVPAAEEMISALDIDAREITFVLPEGLLDLYL
jgi:16S rRNA processing protein rimM